LHHSTLGLIVIQKKKKVAGLGTCKAARDFDPWLRGRFVFKARRLLYNTRRDKEEEEGSGGVNLQSCERLRPVRVDGDGA
jgi:hypothetical protein